MNSLTDVTTVYKQLVENLYVGLISGTVQHMSKVKGKDGNGRAHAALIERWYPTVKKGVRRSDKERQHDDMTDYLFAEKHGLSSLLANKDISDVKLTSIYNSFINYCIDQYRHEHTAKQTIQHNTFISMNKLSSKKEQAVINKWENDMINLMDEQVVEENMFDKQWDALVAFRATLTKNEKVVLSYIIYPGTDSEKRQTLTYCMDELDVSRATFFRQVTALKVRATTFLSTYKLTDV